MPGDPSVDGRPQPGAAGAIPDERADRGPHHLVESVVGPGARARRCGEAGECAGQQAGDGIERVRRHPAGPPGQDVAGLRQDDEDESAVDFVDDLERDVTGDQDHVSGAHRLDAARMTQGPLGPQRDQHEDGIRAVPGPGPLRAQRRDRRVGEPQARRGAPAQARPESAAESSRTRWLTRLRDTAWLKSASPGRGPICILWDTVDSWTS